MNPDLRKALARQFARYRAVADRAGVTMRCLDEDAEAPETTTEVDGTEELATVRVQGPLDDWWGFDVRSLIARLDEMDPKAIHVLIESPGGFLDDGLALYNDLRRRARDKDVAVTTEASGVVASAAVLPFLAGEDRRMVAGTSLMIHDPWMAFVAVGDAAEIEAQVKRRLNGLRNGASTLRDVFAERTDNTREDLDGWLGTDTWFTPDEATEHGFATEVVTEGTGGGNAENAEAQAFAARLYAAWRTRPHLQGVA